MNIRESSTLHQLILLVIQSRPGTLTFSQSLKSCQSLEMYSLCHFNTSQPEYLSALPLLSTEGKVPLLTSQYHFTLSTTLLMVPWTVYKRMCGINTNLTVCLWKYAQIHIIMAG